MQNLTKIQGLAILDKNGDRVIANYNSRTHLNAPKAQAALEKRIEEQLRNSTLDTELLTMGTHLIVARIYNEFYLVLIADQSENELLLEQVLETLTEGIGHFCGKNLKLPVIFRYYTEILLLFDEVLSDGVIVSLDHDELVSRVMMNDKMSVGKTPGKKGFFF